MKPPPGNTSATVLMFLVPALALGQAPTPPKLLPTEAAAGQVRAIQAKLAGTLKGPYASEEQQRDEADRNQTFDQLKEVVSRFVIAQLEAEPRLSESQLHDRLTQILGFTDADRSRRAFAFRNYYNYYIESDPAVWAIAYNGDAWYGLGGSRIAIESYLLEHGKARRTGRAAPELDGHDLEAERVFSPGSLSISFLVHGIYQWSSGHSLPSDAILYSVASSGIKNLLSVHGGSLVFVGPLNTGFVIQYHDESRHQANLPSTAVDIYITNEDPPRRLVHEFID